MNQQEKVMRDIAKRLKLARRDAGLTQEEVGGRIGLTKVGYGHYERGLVPIGVAQLFQLSDILGVSVAYLLGLDSDLTKDEDELLTLYRQIETPQLKALARDMLRGLASVE